MVADDNSKLQAVTSVGNVAATGFEAGFFVDLLRGFTQIDYAKMRSGQQRKIADEGIGRKRQEICIEKWNKNFNRTKPETKI